MRAIVCGGRDYRDAVRLNTVLDSMDDLTLVISGCYKGADTLALRWAMSRQVEFRGYPAKWGRPGTIRRSAGPIRNQRMLDDGEPDLVIAFPGGTGTANMLRLARAAGVPTKEIS